MKRRVPLPAIEAGELNPHMGNQQFESSFYGLGWATLFVGRPNEGIWAFPTALQLLARQKGLVIGRDVQHDAYRASVLYLPNAGNDLHWSHLCSYWADIFKTIMIYGVQVFAHTQSMDSIRAFAHVSDPDTKIIRLESIDPVMIRQVHYSQDEFKVAVQQNVEMR